MFIAALEGNKIKLTTTAQKVRKISQNNELKKSAKEYTL